MIQKGQEKPKKRNVFEKYVSSQEFDDLIKGRRPDKWRVQKQDDDDKTIGTIKW